MGLQVTAEPSSSRAVESTLRTVFGGRCTVHSRQQISIINIYIYPITTEICKCPNQYILVLYLINQQLIIL